MQISSLHPIINHFSICLVVLGILVDYFAFLTNQEPARRFAWLALRLGLCFMAISILTGLIAETNVVIPPDVHDLAISHKITSFIALAAVAVAILLRFSARDKFFAPERAGFRGAYLALTAVSLVLTIASVNLGMSLVYKHGVNVGTYGNVATPQSNAVPMTPAAPPASPDSLHH
jgi:uncharacterized membrane protein